MQYPFTVRVSTVVSTWTGKLKRKLIFEGRYATPEAMMAEASKWDERNYSVTTHEPEFWDDHRSPAEDESIDYAKDDWADGGMPF